MKQDADIDVDHNDYFEPYAYFARTLRLWFIAYGIGAPVAIVAKFTGVLDGSTERTCNKC